MSEQINRPKRRKKDRWFLRADDGAVYGPATMETLKAWCLDGRIEPGNELSRDQETWVPAQSVPELEMDWHARLDDGTRIGPFPLSLVPGLLENGIIHGNSILEHRVTGETRPAVPGSVPVLQDDVRLLHEELAAARSALLEREQQLREQQNHCAGTENEIARLKAQLEQLARERNQALRQIESLSVRQRRPSPSLGRLLVIALFLVLLAATVVIVGLKSCRRQPPSASAGDAGMPSDSPDPPPLPAAGTLDLQPDTTLLPEPDAVPPVGMEPSAVSWPAIALPQASISKTSRAMRIVFNNGLFSAATRLTPEAQSVLVSLAEQLRGKLNGHQLMIEGHTDATPVQSGGSRYVDNFALGMARAEAVREFLVSNGRLPAESMRTASAGDSSPPFANDTVEGRMKNRTVIITLVMR